MRTRIGISVAALLRALATAFVAVAVVSAQPQQQGDQPPFRFRTGVDLINVTATVTDSNGRFVSGLRKEDFRLYEDEVPQEITHFNAERVPVSLGLVIDTSTSMIGDKWTNAKSALNRFLFELLDPADEIFLYRFDNIPELVEGWTTDRSRIATALDRIRPRGATALYDAVIEALPLAKTGRHRKKALVVISDGNDSNSRATIRQVKALVRESEIMVYAIGIDSVVLPWRDRQPSYQVIRSPQSPRWPVPAPFPTPGGRRPPGTPPPGTPPTTPVPGTPPTTPPTTPAPNPPSPPVGGPYASRGLDDRVNIAALRDITDDSGGRTEIVRSPRDLDPATASIADELSRQYYLGYSSQTKRDGQWHTIRVDVRDGRYLVRARRGYVAQ
jgi:VWFA-related protein